MTPLICIYLNPPAPKEIVPSSNLLADTQSALPTDTAAPAVLKTDAQGLLDYAQTLITGDELMFTMEVPYVPVQDTPIVLAQAAAPGAGATPQPDYILNTCKETESTDDSMSAVHAVDPAYGLANFLNSQSNKQVVFDLASIKTTLLKGPTHGEITSGTTNYGRTAYSYDATPNYVGKDQAVFMAEFEGKRYKIVVNLVVSLQINENPLLAGQKPVCPPPTLIKVNGKPVSGSSSYDLNSIPVTFADLTGSALGQTNASGITLDTNASGYNWFIDTTPGLNEEFLPTSNPNEWVAKAGSAAAGKMDMLSVLLHRSMGSDSIDRFRAKGTGVD
jgi:hypothetical protein